MSDLKTDHVKGVIFDLRGNNGGDEYNISMILAPFLTKPLKIGETRTKNGPGRLDYTPWGPLTIQPAPVDKRVKNPNIPVVALVNEYSISCGEITPMALREMPNGYVMGKQTYGATGPRLGDDNPIPLSGGSFKNGYLVKEVMYAGYATRSVHGVNYEGIGVPVHKTLPFGEYEWDRFENYGEDLWLEAAVEYIESEQ
jgi:C-terminal processing protease CtpA/Prc